MRKATTEIKTPLNPLLLNPLAKFEPLQQVPLIERIGIDRSVVFSFRLLELDTEHIYKIEKNKNCFVELVENDNSPIQLKNGKRIGKLIIKDKFLGKLIVGFRKSNLVGTCFIESTLEMTVSGKNQNNLQNLNAKEYRDRIDEIFKYLKDTYTLEVDYSTLKVKKLELNATFFLDEPYEKYKYPILMMIRNVSPKRFGKNKNNNTIKYATWHEADSKIQQDKLETALVKNSSIELKIYNKGKHLQDIGELGELEQDIMRVEYTIKDKRILEGAFGSNSIENITDEKINKLFKKYFNRDVVEPFKQWRSKNRKDLVKLVNKHRSQTEKWTGYFFRECRQYAEINGLPILFDIEDMELVIKELEPKGSKNAKKKFNRLKKKAVYETDLIGNTRRIKEIINAILEM